ncbi:MAG: metallophosphoesterase [Arenimonas sp.]
MRTLLIALLLWSPTLLAAPRQLDDHHWDQVDRIVAIGDLHGDYASYIAVLKDAGVVDAKGQWIGGATHLVQTGDIPDRGPDTRRIITHMAKLAQQAARRGGRVHNLMGNHEAMNVTGDLRYVVEGEFAAFADSRSAARRDRYFEQVMDNLKRSDPQRLAALPADYRATWDREHPLGWVEHRAAWDPRWNPKAEMFGWTLRTQVAIQLNDLVFAHGGIGSAYCGNSLDSLTELARAALRSADPAHPGILEDERGPLWYRGLAGVAPAASIETVDAILARHGAKHLVIGHTPTGGVIWPRLDGRVIMIDTGMSAAYGSHVAWFEETRQGLFAGYPGGKLPLPKDDAARTSYLDAVIAMDPDNDALRKRRDELREGKDPVPDETGAGSAPLAQPAPTCDISR